jgi:hypothetical protein
MVVVVGCASLFLAAGCGGDDGGPTSPQDRLIGTWNCTMFEVTDRGVTVDFMDFVDSFAMTLTSGGTYTLSFTGDDDHILCGGTSCTESGTYSATNSRITWTAFEMDEWTVNYSISGNALTMTGTAEDLDFEFRFVKAS